MKQKGTGVFSIARVVVASALFVTILLLWLIGPPAVKAAAGINEQLNFQGRLLDSTGAVVADGNYNMQFKIYQDGNGILGGGDETLKWTETRLNNSSQGVVVKNGYFSVNLGSITAFGASVDWNQDTLWLSIHIGGTAPTCTPFSTCAGAETEMDPFKRLSSTPYALNSKTLQGLTASNFVQLAQGMQTDATATATASIAVNRTAGTGHVLQLQKSSADVLVIDTNGVSTLYDDVDLTLAGTENLTLTNTTGSNAVDLINLTLTNNDAGAAAQRGIVLTNADSTSTTEALLALDNADATASSLTDGIIITSSGVNNGIADAIDVSADNISNALNVGANTITGAGYLITSTATGLTVNSTSANLALQTTTSGDINLSPAGGVTVTLPSGTTDFNINGLDSDSNLIVTGLAGNNAILYADTSGIVKTAATSTGSQCLLSGAA
ncbi:hypothetical protein A3F65_01980, partial [Candidatus Saccharibacteria bacterium RIFCSPHIGHO2_12_FULL_47_16b]